jgi:hypothetical protein
LILNELLNLENFLISVGSARLCPEQCRAKY